MIKARGFFSLSLALVLSGTGLLSLIWGTPHLLGYHPPPLQQHPVVCPAGTPKLRPGQPVKLMSWNIQALVGSYYPYWLSSLSQPPLTPADIEKTLDKIVATIREEQPDILLLQEVHITHPVTLGRNQLDMLYQRLSSLLPCYSAASYWNTTLIPRKRLMGKINMSLVTMSALAMDESTQQLLPPTRLNRAVVPFYPRHSLQEVRFPLQHGGSLTTINTHLDAPTLGRGLMLPQVNSVLHRLARLTEKRRMWVFAGDLNLIPPGFYPTLPDNQKPNYSPESLLTPFYQAYHGLPALSAIQGPERERWLTAYDLNPQLELVLDYIFYPPGISAANTRVRQMELTISDHMPIITTLYLPETGVLPSRSRQH